MLEKVLLDRRHYRGVALGLRGHPLGMARGPAPYAVAYRPVHQEIATVYVGRQHFVVGIVIDGVTPAYLPETEVKVEEETELPGAPGQVEDLHAPQKDVTVEVHHVVEDQREL